MVEGVLIIFILRSRRVSCIHIFIKVIESLDMSVNQSSHVGESLPVLSEMGLLRRCIVCVCFVRSVSRRYVICLLCLHESSKMPIMEMFLHLSEAVDTQSDEKLTPLDSFLCFFFGEYNIVM